MGYGHPNSAEYGDHRHRSGSLGVPWPMRVGSRESPGESTQARAWIGEKERPKAQGITRSQNQEGFTLFKSLGGGHGLE